MKSTASAIMAQNKPAAPRAACATTSSGREGSSGGDSDGETRHHRREDVRAEAQVSCEGGDARSVGGGRVAHVSGHAVIRGGLQVFSEGSASRLERGVARGARRGFERDSAAAGEVLEARTRAGGIGRAEGGGDVAEETEGDGVGVDVCGRVATEGRGAHGIGRGRRPQRLARRRGLTHRETRGIARGGDRGGGHRPEPRPPARATH